MSDVRAEVLTRGRVRNCGGGGAFQAPEAVRELIDWCGPGPAARAESLEGDRQESGRELDGFRVEA